MIRSLIAVVCVSLFLPAGKTATQDWKYDVPFVPTKRPVVEEMLKMANVDSDDILYDLGCGDGRIVITAAEKKGTRGVGIDLDPERIRECRENAEKFKVENLVRFNNNDLFTADFSEATVVALYLLTEVNMKLRPRILRELQPGTRIVSHNYAMGDWESDKFRELMVDSELHYVYLWVVPANAGGTWEWTLPWEDGEKRYALKLTQNFQKVDGTVTSEGKTTPVIEPLLKGKRLQFTVETHRDGHRILLYFDGIVNGNSIEGTAKPFSDSTLKNLHWSARRDPMTVKPLDTK